jgi:AraC-like DNA-binding protein
MTSSSERQTLRFSSNDLPPHQRKEMFCDLMGRNILKVALDPDPDSLFEANMTFRAWPDLGLGFTSVSPVRSKHLASAADNDDLLLVLTSSGAIKTRNNRSEEAIVQAGEAILAANGEIGSLVSQGSWSSMSLRLNREMFLPHSLDLNAAVGRVIPERQEALRLLTHYVHALEDTATLASPELRRTVIAHIYDLAALAIGAVVAGERGAGLDGVGAARLRAMKEDILRQLDEPSLSASAVARRQGVSERYLRQLFASEGRSFLDFVTEQRLLKARQLLTGHGREALSITTVALDCGYSDPSYFNRVFRRHFGVTPTEFREANLNETQGSDVPGNPKTKRP